MELLIQNKTNEVLLHKKYILLIISLVSIIHLYSQELTNLKKQKPFTIKGNIGASANFYSSNEITPTRPAFSWNTYGNFTPTVYGIALPFSFSINQYGKSYSQPFTQFGLSPTYKWAKVHLGYRTMQMSPLIFDGQSFLGAGTELNPKLFRFGAFYGRLNRKINEDTTSGRFAQPQFSRIGYGVKLGIGNSTTYFDLIYFHAKDDSSSAKVINKNGIFSQENSVLGTAFKITLLKKITWSADMALSGLTQNLSDSIAQTDTLGLFEKLFSKLMPFRSSTIVNYAGQTTLTIALKGYTTMLGYRRVEPGFKSLGTPYMINDIELINWMNNFNLLKNKLTITTSLSNQHNNLKNKLASELHTFVSNFSANALISQGFNLNINYNGYRLLQKDGTVMLSDSAKINQQIQQFSIMPSYTIIRKTKTHTISGSLNYMLLTDNNPATQKFTSSNNISSSVNYSMGLQQKAMSFSVSGIYSQYKQDTNTYKTIGATFSNSTQLLKQKNLNLQGSIGYLFNQSSLGSAQSNLTFSATIGYHYKHHSFNCYTNYIYTPYNPINDIITKIITQSVASKNLAGGISYNYSF